MKMKYTIKRHYRKIWAKTQVTCWCCHNDVSIGDSGACPICGAIN